MGTKKLSTIGKLRKEADVLEEYGTTQPEMYAKTMREAADELAQLSRANAELRAALETATAAMSLQQVLERGRNDKTAHGWTPIIERCNAALGTSKLTTTEAKK